MQGLGGIKGRGKKYFTLSCGCCSFFNVKEECRAKRLEDEIQDYKTTPDEVLEEEKDV